MLASNEQRTLITGGTGFIGLNLFGARASHAHHWVMARTKPSPAFCDRFIAADVRHYRFKRGEFAHIIHAAEAGPEATENVVKSGAKVLLISSGAASRPGTPYADAKIESEKIVRDHGGGICRIYSVIGPHLPFDGAFAAGNFVRDALLKGTIKINGDGTPIRSYLYATEMARHVWNALSYVGKTDDICEVGSSVPVNILWLAEEIAKQAEKKTGRAVEVEVDFGEPESLAPHRYLPDDGIKPQIGIKEAISKTLDWAIGALL